jgi:DeoR/GlpR family transcriptional regulator of sugar metabolism
MSWKIVHDTPHATTGLDLAAARRQRLGALVDARRAIRLEELSAALGVSQATVRRDLNALAAAGRLRRVHGGAVAADQRLDEPHFDDKAGAAAEEKGRIAARAVELLSPHDTVYLDSGSTVLGVARLLHGWSHLTVVTNSLPVATELVGRGPRLILVGGEVRATSRAIVGPLTRLLLESLHLDRALMGTFAFSLEDGLSTTDPAEAYTKDLVLARAGEVILLADSTKAGTRSFVRAGDLDRIHTIVTDTGIDERLVRSLKRRGIRVIAA